MKRILILSLAIFSIIFLFYISNKPQKTLKNYLEIDLKPVIDSQNKILSDYSSLIKDKSIKPENIIVFLDEEIIPQCEQNIVTLNNISSSSKDIQILHDLLLKASDAQLSAFITYKNGLESNDINTIYNAEKILKECKTLINDFNDKVKKLQEQY